MKILLYICNVKLKMKMKKFLIVLLPFIVLSCNDKNESKDLEVSVDSTRQDLIMIDDTLRVVYDTVSVINDQGQVEYFYSYDNFVETE